MESRSRAAHAASTSTDIFGDTVGEGSNAAAHQPGDAVEQRDPGLDDEEEEEGEGEDGVAPMTEGNEVNMLQDDDEAAQRVGHDMYESDSPSESGTDSLTWISWFCSLPGHEYFAEVSEDFIEDEFNLTGLNALVPFYKEALEMILDVEPQEDSLKIPDVSIVESSAELLYGLIHQRYILTRQGLQQMADKYERGHFGFCPRVFCHSHPVLPCGRSDLPGLDTVKLFCANCIDNYSPPSSRFHGVDGAFFGTTFPHLLFQTYKELMPAPVCPPGTNFASLNTQTPQPGSSSGRTNGQGSRDSEGSEGVAAGAAAASAATPGTAEATGGPIPATARPASAPSLNQDVLGTRFPQARLYTPRIYGFRVSEYAKSGPRMRWLRMRPESFEELDYCYIKTDMYPSAAKGWKSSVGGIGLQPGGATASATAVATNAADTVLPTTGETAAEAAAQAAAPAHPGIDASGRSTATGRPMAGRVPSSQSAAIHGATEGL